MAGDDLQPRRKKRAKAGVDSTPEVIEQHPPAETLLAELSQIRPNSWNPNKLEKTAFQKLKHGIKSLVLQGQDIPPIVVRRTSGEPTDFEIIDGEHRYRAFSDLFQETKDDRYWKIPVWCLSVDNATARTLTLTLNYLRGEPKEQEYAKVIESIIREGAWSLDKVASWLPEDEGKLQLMLEEYASADFDIEAAIAGLIPTDGDELDRSTDVDVSHRLGKESFTVLEIRVPADLGLVFSDELDRLKGYLRATGTSEEGLQIAAFEAMVLNSANTPLDQVKGEPERQRRPRRDVFAGMFDDTDE